MTDVCFCLKFFFFCFIMFHIDYSSDSPSSGGVSPKVTVLSSTLKKALSEKDKDASPQPGVSSNKTTQEGEKQNLSVSSFKSLHLVTWYCSCKYTDFQLHWKCNELSSWKIVIPLWSLCHLKLPGWLMFDVGVTIRQCWYSVHGGCCCLSYSGW